MCPSGLVVDERIVYKGDITISSSLRIKNGLADTSFDLSKSIAISIDLINKGSFNFFDEKYMSSIVKYKFSSNAINASDELKENTSTAIDGTKTSISIVNNNSDYNLSELDTLNFKVVYSFDFGAYKDTFEEDIYNKLGDSPLNFSLHFEVRSV